MTAEQLAKIQRDFLTRTENQSAVQLAAEFEAVKTEIFNSLLRQNLSDGTARVLSELYRKTFLDKILDDFSVKAGSIVRRAQGRAINFASESLERFLPKIKSSIFAADTDSIQKLIGRTQTGESLVKFFKRFKPIIRQRAQRIFIDSFAEGVSNEAIARRLAQAAGAQKHRVLTISRTETNQAYRAASREFYQAAGIEEYIWLETLDARTCLICWLQHGRVFPSRVKFSNHPNCRGVMAPYFGEKIETGIEKFNRLETGFQQQILGRTRFELFKDGARLEDFLAERQSAAFGKTHFIKPLSELSGDDNKMFRMAMRESKRGTTFLTQKEFAEAKDYAVRLGMPKSKIYLREGMNTSWGIMFGREMLNLAPDLKPVLRLSGRTLPPNSYISWKGGIAHEVIGHRQAALLGKTQSSLVLEEAQASLRAAMHAPELSVSERRMLIRDARFRLKKYGIIYREVKDSLWLEPFQQ